jgi:hypothetical protein
MLCVVLTFSDGQRRSVSALPSNVFSCVLLHDAITVSIILRRIVERPMCDVGEGVEGRGGDLIQLLSLRTESE